MADLVTHGCVAILAKAAVPGARHVPTFVAGTCLPDLLSRVPSIALTRLRYEVQAVPEAAIYVWGPLHMPLGIALGSYVASFLFPAADRRWALANLLGGGLLHLAVDMLQSHFGVGYLLFFPFSLADFELGWIGSEDTVRIVPFLLPLTALVAWLRWRRR